MSEWVEHNGGECPVKNMDDFQFLYRSGRKVRVRAGGEAYCWKHLGASHDIVAYRIISPSPEPVTPPKQGS